MAIIQSPGTDLHLALPAQGAALVVQGLGRVQGQVAAGDNALAAVVEIPGVEADIAVGVARVIGIDPGFDDALVAQLATAVQLDAVAGGEGFLAAQVTLGLHLEFAAGVDPALGLQAAGLDRHRALLGSGVRHAQLAVGIQLDITATGD
ncbi:hypothetical protein QN071_18570, partial [Pseudomonas protegens]